MATSALIALILNELVLCFKALEGKAPHYIVDLISVVPSRKYNLRQNNNGILLCQPSGSFKNSLGERAFSRAAPKLWNVLELCNLSSVDIFKN